MCSLLVFTASITDNLLPLRLLSYNTIQTIYINHNTPTTRLYNVVSLGTHIPWQSSQMDLRRAHQILSSTGVSHVLASPTSQQSFVQKFMSYPDVRKFCVAYIVLEMSQETSRIHFYPTMHYSAPAVKATPRLCCLYTKTSLETCEVPEMVTRASFMLTGDSYSIDDKPRIGRRGALG